MVGTTGLFVGTSTRSGVKRSKSSQPQIAACNLWSSGNGQLHPWSIQQPRAATLQRVTSTSSMINTGPAMSRPRLGSKSASTTDLRKVVSAPSRTTAPLFPDQILDNLYISDLETACAVLSPNYAAPGRPQIKYVLTVLDKDKDAPQVVASDEKQQFVQKFIKINDWSNVNLLQHLPETHDFIKQSLANQDGGVLVHCRKGVSRSGSVIVAYVMEALQLQLDDAIKYVVERRPKVLPNAGFKQQLQLWEEMCFSLVDEGGAEKLQYQTWREQSHFRIC